MSFTCKNCGAAPAPGNRLCPQCGLLFNQPVPPVQAPRVTLSSPSPAKKANRSWFALLLVMGIGIMGLMSAGCGTQTPAPASTPSVDATNTPASTTGNTSTGSTTTTPTTFSDTSSAQTTSGSATPSSESPSLSLALSQVAPANGETSRPSGVLTFTTGGDLFGGSMFDYNISTRELTDYGEGQDVYRAKNGTAIVAVHHADDSDYDLVVVSSEGKTRTRISKNFQDYSGNFILSPDGSTALYGTHTDDPKLTPILAIHNIQTGKERLFASSVGALVPEDWTPDGRLLITPFEEQQPVMSDGKPFILNFMLVSKDYSHTNYANVDQPGAKPVTQIFDPRVDPSGKRLAFAWDDHIWVSSADGSGAKQVTDSETGAYEKWSAWSPDGKWLAVAHKTRGAVHIGGSPEGIYLVPVDGNTHSMSDPAVKELKDNAGKSIDCDGRITWR